MDIDIPLGLPYPEHLMPALRWQPVNQPISNRFCHADIDKLLDGQRRIWSWAIGNHIAVLSVSADRNGAYACVVANPCLYELLGDECTKIFSKIENGLILEYWIGLVGELRVFWREVKCVH